MIADERRPLDNRMASDSNEKRWIVGAKSRGFDVIDSTVNPRQGGFYCFCVDKSKAELIAGLLNRQDQEAFSPRVEDVDEGEALGIANEGSEEQITAAAPADGPTFESDEEERGNFMFSPAEVRNAKVTWPDVDLIDDEMKISTEERLVRHRPQAYSDHQRLDARSLAMHCLVARKLLANSALIAQARSTLARWRARAAEPVPSYFVEWARILEGSPEEIAAFLASMHEDATRLRQSSPFTKLLTSGERARIYAAFR
jgi:hypothetical protein